MVSINIYWFIFKVSTSTRICYKGYNMWYAEIRVVHDVEQVQYHTIWADSLSKIVFIYHIEFKNLNMVSTQNCSTGKHMKRFSHKSNGSPKHYGI